MIKEIETNRFNSEIASGISVVDFYATWCGPCKMLSPVIQEISNEIENIKFFKVDIDKNPSLASQYNISSVPSVLIFKNGNVINTSLGFKPKEILKQEIEKFL